MIEYVDIEVDDDGDLVLDSTGDLKIATVMRTIAQDVIFRVRTETNDFKPHPTLGSNAIIMKGEVNNRYNGELIQQMVTRSLTYDGRFHAGEFSIDVIPVSESVVMLLIVFPAVFENVPAASRTTNALVLSFNFNYDTGVIEPIAGPGQSGSGSAP